ncbi:MAG: glycosyltransferase [Caldilineaceae bacterium]|jgi:spore maturation protein CgeB|nr:glycosyltransferase [Caldilineaceae bacterium]
MKIAFFGSSLVSAYWNGAATYYRGIIRGLHERGHLITFYEPDAYDRQQHRDMDDPAWARVVVYAAEDEQGVRAALKQAADADLIVKTSGVGVFDDLLEAAVLDLKRPQNIVLFWDVDAPATLDRVQHNANDPFRALIPRYDSILTYGGGPAVVAAYRTLGARGCYPIYNAVDPLTHYPTKPDTRFQGLCGFTGHRLPDREARVDEFFFRSAAALPDHQFVLGGNGWEEKVKPENVAYAGYVSPRDHNAFNSTVRAVLNINRDSMARYGFSPPTRVFEAAGAAACLITDAWEGIEEFLQPGREILVATNGEEVVAHLRGLSHERARQIGAAARQRVLAQHTYQQRVMQLEKILDGEIAGRALYV